MIKFKHNQKGFTPHLLKVNLDGSSLSDKKGAGFTLAELLISIVIGMIIFMIITSTFLLNQRVFRKSNIKAELAQNARITLDLMAREIRQANETVTILPATDTSAPAELQFEDGHTNSHIQYIRYYTDGTNLKRQIVVYYFESEPLAYVHWDDVDPFGSPTQAVLQDRIIGENFSDIDFWGSSNINIELVLSKQNETIEIKSIIQPRNN